MKNVRQRCIPEWLAKDLHRSGALEMFKTSVDLVVESEIYPGWSAQNSSKENGVIILVLASG